MRRLALAVLLAAAVAAPAFAQNPAQIAKVRAGASCPRCNLFQADLGALTLRGRDYTGARLRQADAQGAVLTHARLAHADLRDLNAYGAVLTGADLRGADLTAATLVGAYLQGADLSGAILSGTNLSGAEMSHARGLTQRQLSAACGDAATTLPRGLSLKPCS
ncbi:pentapeptide repeat-containing protein [soil metagenome]